jgi:hypothetical protein
MKSVIAACCMVIIGSVAAHPEESSLKRFRVATTPAMCVSKCSSAFSDCRMSCGATNTPCLNQCNAAYAACERSCNG